MRNAEDSITSKPQPTPIAPVTRKIRRGRDKRPRREMRQIQKFAASPVVPAADPVRIAVLAMESLGRASMRACFTGIEVEVVVPDSTTAAIFRAAIAETAQARPTDRLIRIVID